MAEIGFLGIHFSKTIMSSSKCVDNSGVITFAFPDCDSIKILSFGLNSPNNSPRPSTFNRCTVSSNQTFRGNKVEIPFSFNSIFLIGYLVTKFPLELLPFIAKLAKSISNFSFLTVPIWRNKIVITSASPFGLQEKYSTCEPAVSLVKSYALSRVTPETLKRFIYEGPDFPSR